MPPLILYNPVLAYETGEDSCAPWFDAAARPARSVHPRARGLGPERGDQRRRALGGAGRRPATRAADPDEHVDRPARAARRRGARARHLRGLRRHPGDAQQPDRRDGPARLPRLALDLAARHPDRQPPRLPGAARQHHRDAAAPGAARSPAPARRSSSTSRAGRSWLFAPHRARGLRPRGVRRAGPVRADARRDGGCLVKLGCKGPVAKCNVPLRGWVNGIGGCPNVGGICMACTMPGFPDKYMPFMEAEPAAACCTSRTARFAYGPVVGTSASARSAALRRRAAPGGGPGAS